MYWAGYALMVLRMNAKMWWRTVWKWNYSILTLYHRLFTESVFKVMDTFFGRYFHFCFELALETWAKASLTQSLWVHDPNHTHSLVSFQWSGLSDQRALQLTESCLQIQKWCPYKARGVVPEPVCANKARNGPATADQGSSLASQGSCHVHGTPGWTHPPPPIPPFLLVQNLSSKQIAPTDNMWPNSDDSKQRHRWLKG